MKILDLPETERPRERCLKNGPECLSLRECLALILNAGPMGVGSLGLAANLLDRVSPGLPTDEQERAFFTAMESSAPAHLQGIPGLGDAAQARLLASFELARRYTLYQIKRPRMRLRAPTEYRPQAVERIPPDLRFAAREWLAFVPIHRSGEVGSLCVVERGVRTHVNVDPMELFAKILALRPWAIVLFHNHPQGELDPSGPDLDLTYRVDQTCRQLGLRLLGHAIVSARGERWIDMV